MDVETDLLGRDDAGNIRRAQSRVNHVRVQAEAAGHTPLTSREGSRHPFATQRLINCTTRVFFTASDFLASGKSFSLSYVGIDPFEGLSVGMSNDHAPMMVLAHLSCSKLKLLAFWHQTPPVNDCPERQTGLGFSRMCLNIVLYSNS